MEHVIEGRVYNIDFFPDQSMGPPWEEHDGHGAVSEWTTRSKRPGERIIAAHHNSRQFYDYDGAIKKAKAEGWSVANSEGMTPAQIATAAVEADFKYLKSYIDGVWAWAVVRTTAPNGDSNCLGGIQSNDQEYINQCGIDLAVEMHDDYTRKLAASGITW